jgi:hypothetical protein
VEVFLEGHVTLERLLEGGFDVIDLRDGTATLLEWPGDADRLERLGATARLLDPDPGLTAGQRARAELAARPAPRPTRVISAAREDGVFRAEGLPPFGSGSMGGFWTLAEVKMKLDQIVADDTDGVVADKLDTLGYTLKGRPIWGLRLGKTSPPMSRPVAYFNSLTHAREPEGMQALLYFVDHLLAGYGTEPTATYLLERRTIYVVPVVNPDGYKHNEDLYVASGGTQFGLWRKNLRDNDLSGTITSSDGVDLNRNFGYQWGFDDLGSSPVPSAQTYRGPGPFSEPESQAQRDAIVARQPVTGISFHTSGDLLLHSWGWTATATPDSAAFYEWNDDMTLGNGYQSGASPRVLYAVNGEFNDWCYGDTGLKPRYFSWTPEVGGPADGFWPAPSRIVPLAQENLRTCYYAAAIAGPHVRVESSRLVPGTGTLDPGYAARLQVQARNKGAAGIAGPGLTATLTPISSGAAVLEGTASYPDLAPLASAGALDGGSFQIAADDTVTPGRVLRFHIDFATTEGFLSRDTIEVLCGRPTIVFADDASAGTGNWTGAWGVESGDPGHPGPYFTDSPGALYPSSVEDPFAVNPTLNLSAGVHAYVQYEARWTIDSNSACGLIEASLDGNDWSPLPARATSLGRTGSATQPPNQPVLDGTRHDWMADRANLSAFTGPAATAVRLRFRFRSSNSQRFDGLAIDSIRVLVFDPAAQPAPVAVGPDARPVQLALREVAPNPMRGHARLHFELARSARIRLDVLDLQGRRVRTLLDRTLEGGAGQSATWDGRDEAGRRVPAGLYVVRLASEGRSTTRRLVLLP